MTIPVTPAATVATVAVKSAWASKINWAQAASALVTCTTAVVGALNLPPAQAASITAGAALIGQIATVILKTFFTASITPASAKLL